MKRSAIVISAGAALSLAAVASVFWMPERWEAVFYVQSSGANEVHVPFGYWMAVAAWLGALVAVNVRLGTVLPRAIVVAFATHMLMALAAFAPFLHDSASFSMAAYQWYARVFCASILAVAVAWSIHAVRQFRTTADAIATPVVIATSVLAVYLFRADSVMAATAAGAGVAFAWAASHETAHARATRVAFRVRAWLTDDRAFTMFVFLLALVLRVWYLQRVMSNPRYVETGADGPVYDELAWSIAQGRGIRESFSDRFPLLLLGYVWFVSGIYWLVGHSYFAVGVVQAIVGSGACVLLHSIAKELCGTTIARTAALFAAVSFPLLFAAAAIGHQAIDVFLTMTIVWLLVKGGDPAAWPWWRWATLGALFGMAIAVRETVTFFLAFALLWIPVLFPRYWSRRAAGAAAMVAAGALLVLGPLVMPKLANVEQRDKLRHHLDVLYRGEADPVRMRDDIVAPIGNPDAALAQLRESPGFVLGTLGRAWTQNFALQFFAQPYGGFDLMFLRKGTTYSYALWFYAYALAFAGMAILLRWWATGRQAAGIALILGLMASRTVPHVILESNYRHRVPIEPFLILLAAVAAVTVIGSARRPLETAH